MNTNLAWNASSTAGPNSYYLGQNSWNSVTPISPRQSVSVSQYMVPSQTSPRQFGQESWSPVLTTSQQRQLELDSRRHLIPTASPRPFGSGSWHLEAAISPRQFETVNRPAFTQHTFSQSSPRCLCYSPRYQQNHTPGGVYRQRQLIHEQTFSAQFPTEHCSMQSTLNSDQGFSSSIGYQSVAKKKLTRKSGGVKEKRRTQAINIGFNALRRCLPDVPFDTKLTKIRTLRLAVNYINQLSQILEADELLHLKENVNSNQKKTNLSSSNPLSEFSLLGDSGIELDSNLDIKINNYK